MLGICQALKRVLLLTLFIREETGTEGYLSKVPMVPELSFASKQSDSGALASNLYAILLLPTSNYSLKLS